MIFFLLILSTYGSVNFYVYRTIAAGLGGDSWILGILIAAFTAAPFSVRFSEGRMAHPFLTLQAAIGYNWMALSWLFTFYTATLQAIALIFPEISSRGILAIGGSLSIATSLHGFVAARQVGLKRWKVQSAKFKGGGKNSFRIVQISDIHLGYGSHKGSIRRIVERINGLKPDLIVSTGDLFDSDLDNLQAFVEIMKKLAAPSGKLAVTGNHEVYGNLKKALELTAQADFKLLQFEACHINEWLAVVGVDDPEVPSKLNVEEEESSLLKSEPPDKFTLLLKHRPAINQRSLGHFDLQLSGHTHGGQIFPFKLLTKLQYRARTGLSRLSRESFLYLSRGTGAWGPKIRFLAPPEITVFDIGAGEGFDIREG